MYAPSRIAYLRTVWQTSTICASGQIDQITPRQVAAAPSRPKSVRNPMTGRALGVGMAGMLAQGHELPVGRQVWLETERPDALGEGGRLARITVDHEDPPRATVGGRGRAEVTQPGLELIMVGMGAEARDGAHPAADRVLGAVDARALPAVGEVTAQRALSLVADEEQCAGRIGQEVLEVMHHAAAGQHAGAGHDHHRPLCVTDRLRGLDAVGELLAGV